MPPTGTPASVTPRAIKAGDDASPLRTGARTAITKTERARRRITWSDRTQGHGRNQGSSQPKGGNQRPDGGATAAASPRRRPSLGDNSGETKGRRDENGHSGATRDRFRDRGRGQGDLRRGRDGQHDKEALRFDRRRAARGQPPPLP